jgi:hypothetical protein
VPNSAYLYVILIDSSGIPSRLYPAALTGVENPVSGVVQVPKDAGAELALDNRPGQERILVFVQKERSRAIESLLGEVRLEGSAPSALAQVVNVLTRGVNVRKKAAEAASAAGMAKGFLGAAAFEFVIIHQ